MLREANLANKKFIILPLVGDMVLTSAPRSVLDGEENKTSAVKIMRRLKEAGELDIDLSGMLKTMEKEDVEVFLKEKSKKMESGMMGVISQSHGAGPKTSPRPHAAPRLSSVRPSPAPK